jgi:hypothetical protein
MEQEAPAASRLFQIPPCVLCIKCGSLLPLLRDATYGHQLNVILPALLRSSTAPQLPIAIRGLLNRLRELRHQMAHEGRLEEDLDRYEAAELLCAALFGFRYVSLVRPFLLPGAQPV